MEIKNALKPNHEQMENFNSGDLDTPIFMVNLLKFKEFACYEDGRETNLTGAEAYNIYSQEVQDRHLKKVGGKIIFSGAVSQLMLGETRCESCFKKIPGFSAVNLLLSQKYTLAAKNVRLSNASLRQKHKTI